MPIPIRRQTLPSLLLLVLTLGSSLSCGSPAPTPDEAQAFMDRAEQELLEAWIESERAAWVQANFITLDTDAMAAATRTEMIGTTMDLAAEATRYDGLELPEQLARKFQLLKTSLSLVAPRDADKQAALSETATAMKSMYGKGEYCRPDGECLDLQDLSRLMRESRDPDELLEAWVGWRTISPGMRPKYEQFAQLGNEGAQALGFSDLGQLWRSSYDMPPEEFAAEVDRLWEQVRPLYEALHCHVRASLARAYGEQVVSLDGPIPAHLLGNMWAQQWGNVYELTDPPADAPGYDLTDILRGNDVDAIEMVEYGERFFSSLGFEPLPETFWERSLFTQPEDRSVVCHASAWDIDMVDDLRIKMCIEINDVDFATVHHELGHNYYQRAYSEQPPLFRNSAHDGFHEGIGDTIALSITQDYLLRVGLLDRAPDSNGDLGLLMRMALDKVAFLPFASLVDQWRWGVFSGEIPAERYNSAWWELREKYQGIRPPVERSEADFDPGAKYHIPANTPYSRYFLAAILQFQFHRALCGIAGFEGPLHQCSIYDNAEAGKRLNEMLEMGMSRPWPDALEALTGEREMDATAILDYFAPLKTWLDEQNEGRSCGW